MLTSIYNRQSGKYTLLKEQLGQWCSTAKKGNTLVVATVFGSYKLRFCGEFKSKTAKFELEGTI